MDIQSRTNRSLEWERLKSYLAAEASTSWSRELCLSLEIFSEPAIVQIALDETDEALAMLAGGFGLSQDGLPEMRDLLARLRTGASLAPSEFVALRKMLSLCKRTRGQLNQLSEADFPALLRYVPRLHVQDKLSAAIDAIFDADGQIRDDASPLLSQLRREVRRLNSQARDELSRIINSSTLAKALQDPIYTQRNGRYVLPVQASSRHVIQGIVHDSSASGLTIYVEPMAVVELTNRARLKESEIEREIERLLADLTALAYAVRDEIGESCEALVEIDFIAARARLAQKYRGVKPLLSSDGTLSLKNARHPLLALKSLHDGSPVVANDIRLGDNVRTLVITGPNTGGKTVFLKTAGLLSLMVRGGLLLPCDPGSSAVIFENVFADIGDEQSIEQSLSTFSSHMTNIIEILNRSDARTLALLDEVGAGTDPREGAVLARVVLEHLNSLGAFTVSTTHYGELKMLAYTTTGFVNGSFEFDEATLSPTYRLRIGVPGSSKAITIAARLGLPASIVSAAEAIIGADVSDLQSMIEEMESRLNEVDKAEQELKRRQDEIVQVEQSLANERLKLQSEREKVRAGLADAMNKELEEARELVRSLIADLQKKPSIAGAQRLQKDLDVIRKDLGWLEPAQPVRGIAALAVGQTVKVLSLNQKAIIEDLPAERSADAQATVRAGAFKIKVPLSDLEPVSGQAPSSRAHPRSRGARAHAEMTPGRLKSGNAVRVTSSQPGELDVFVRTARNTLDLRGQRVDEALQHLESFVDSCFLEHVSPLMIIHGHGMGKVKAAVRKFLTESPYGASFRPGENYEGGDGVTVVQFK